METQRKVKDVPEFEVRKHLILEYQHKNFRNNDQTVSLKYFPIWNNSKEFNFNLYVEVKRTPADSPLEEFENGKRLRLKVSDIYNHLYQQHFIPSVYHKDTKILTTRQYVPEFLKKLVDKNAGDSHHIYIQNKPIIERPLSLPSFPARKRKLISENEDGNHNSNNQLNDEQQKKLDEQNTEINRLHDLLKEKNEESPRQVDEARKQRIQYDKLFKKYGYLYEKLENAQQNNKSMQKKLDKQNAQIIRLQET